MTEKEAFDTISEKFREYSRQACERLQSHLSVFRPFRMEEKILRDSRYLGCPPWPYPCSCPYSCKMVNLLPSPARPVAEGCCNGVTYSSDANRFVNKVKDEFDELAQEIDTLQASTMRVTNRPTPAPTPPPAQWKVSERGVDLCP